MPSIWATLSLDEKRDILKRKTEGEEITNIAQELGMYGPTLDRRLREFAQFDSSSEKVEPIKREEGDILTDNPDPNHLVLSSHNSRIQSTNDLLKICNVDPKEWEVERSQIGTSEGYRRDEQRELVFDEGRITGSISDRGRLYIETLYSVKVWLVRRKPVPIDPIVSPVKFSFSYKSGGSRVESQALSTALIIPDTHIGFKRNLLTGELFPFHDRKALDILAQIAENYVLDVVVILGDFLDLPEWSDRFLSSPEFEQVTQPALAEAAWWLARFRSSQVKGARFFYIEGNHEERIPTAIIKNLPQAYRINPVNKKISYSAWTIPSLLDLEGLNIEWVGDYPNGEVWLTENLRCVHGDGLSSDKIVASSEVSTIFGHIHRLEMSSRAIYRKGGVRNITAMCPGFLGLQDGSVPGIKNNQRWSQGAAIVQYSPNEHSIIHIPISKGRAVFDGSVWVGENKVKEIASDLGGLSLR